MSRWRFIETDEAYRLLTHEQKIDLHADIILTSLRSDGALSKTQISGLFSRNLSAEQINDALLLLQNRGQVRSFRVKKDPERPGRPSMYWEAA